MAGFLQPASYSHYSGALIVRHPVLQWPASYDGSTRPRQAPHRNNALNTPVTTHEHTRSTPYEGSHNWKCPWRLANQCPSCLSHCFPLPFAACSTFSNDTPPLPCLYLPLTTGLYCQCLAHKALQVMQSYTSFFSGLSFFCGFTPSFVSFLPPSSLPSLPYHAPTPPHFFFLGNSPTAPARELGFFVSSQSAMSACGPFLFFPAHHNVVRTNATDAKITGEAEKKYSYSRQHRSLFRLQVTACVRQ